VRLPSLGTRERERERERKQEKYGDIRNNRYNEEGGGKEQNTNIFLTFSVAAIVGVGAYIEHRINIHT
jgi:hypothetical protein